MADLIPFCLTKTPSPSEIAVAVFGFGVGGSSHDILQCKTGEEASLFMTFLALTTNSLVKKIVKKKSSMCVQLSGYLYSTSRH